MLGMPTFDLTTERGKQDFQKWITFSIKNEINSYARQVLNLGLEGASGGGGTPTGPAGGVLSGNYPNPSFAVDMATQAELDAAIAALNAAGIVYQNTPYLDFDTVTPGASGVGQLAWNDTNGTLEFILKGGNVALDIGQENVALVKHADNTGLTKGKVVYVTGSDGTNKTVRYAQANSEATSSKTFGVMAEDATGGSKGFVCTQGIVYNINTLALAEGAAVYVSPTTAGDLTSTKPSAPNHMVLVGFCVRSHASLGVLYISVVNGFELQELHNVSINIGTLANGDVIKYNSSTQLWENVAADDIPAHASTHIPGGSDALDLTKIIDKGTTLPTSFTLYPAGTLFAFGSSAPYLLYRSTGSAWEQLGSASTTVSDTAPASPQAGALWYNSSNGKTYIYYADGSSNQWVEIGENAQVTIPGHAGTHIRGGSDIIDGDRITIDYVPTTYTRNSAASNAGNVTDLTAHLSGIDNYARYGQIVCTSTTRPSSPLAGMSIYETDTNRVMFYNGSIWLPPKGTIAQVVSFNGLVSDNTTSTGYVDSNFALSITPTTNTNSRIIANFSIAVYVPAANNGIAMAINKYINGVFSAHMVYASTGGHNLYLYSSAAGQHANVPFTFTETPNTTGVVTYRAVFRSYTGSVVYLGNGGNTPCTGVLQEIII